MAVSGALRALTVVAALTAATMPTLGGTVVTQNVAASTTTAVHTVNFTLRDLPIDQRPTNGVATRVDTGTHDASGVRMYSLHGHLYNHPVSQAAYGLANLAAYRDDHDPFFLRRAIAQANRLVASRVTVGGAWFYPYRYDFALHGGKDGMHPPWYSAMAQGKTLSLFTALYQQTHDSKWQRYAAATFASYLVKPSRTRPWVDHVDQYGYLWLDEYARWPSASSDLTLNGHIFSMYGLYNYYESSHDPRALALFDEAGATVLHYFTAFREPRWRSFYYLQHHHDSLHYHAIHTAQFRMLYALTGDVRFAEFSDTLFADYPTPEATSGTVRLAKGNVTGYRFDADGRVIGTRTLHLTRTSLVRGTERIRIRGRGIYYRISSGSLAGYDVAESTTAIMLGTHQQRTYVPPRRLTLRTGTFTGEPATFDARAIVDGIDSIHIASGPLTGRWLPATRVSLDH